MRAIICLLLATISTHAGEVWVVTDSKATSPSSPWVVTETSITKQQPARQQQPAYYYQYRQPARMFQSDVCVGSS